MFWKKRELDFLMLTYKFPKYPPIRCYWLRSQKQETIRIKLKAISRIENFINKHFRPCELMIDDWWHSLYLISTRLYLMESKCDKVVLFQFCVYCRNCVFKTSCFEDTVIYQILYLGDSRTDTFCDKLILHILETMHSIACHSTSRLYCSSVLRV